MIPADQWKNVVDHFDASCKWMDMVRYLEEQIFSGAFAGGSRIPSTRELARRFGISQNTALAGINYLVQQGLLIKHPRSGVSVVENWHRVGAGSGMRKGQSALEIAVFGVMRNTALYGASIRGIKEYAEEQNINLQLFMMPFYASDQAVMQQLAARADGVLLLSEYDVSFATLSFGKPAVGIMMHNTYGGTISIVDIDPFDVAAIAAEFFESKNIHTVYGVGETVRPNYAIRLELFRSRWTAMGREYHFWKGSELGELRQCDIRCFVRKDCGYFFGSDSMLNYACIEYLQKTGRSLVKDFCVLGVDGKNRNDPEMNKFPSIAADWRQMGRIALRECVQQIQHGSEPAKRIYIKGNLILP